MTYPETDDHVKLRQDSFILRSELLAQMTQQREKHKTSPASLLMDEPLQYPADRFIYKSV
jgi:hypothetical protein